MKRLPLRIRSFQEEDLETLCEIDRICFADDIAFSRTELLSQINHAKSITRVGEGLGRILGFVIARIENDAHAHVLTLDVVPDARRCRIGISLMRALHRALTRENIEVAFLEVSVRNLPAQRLYEKLQYQYLETLYGYYQGREDAYRMVRIVR
ncbi:MAG TPA: N-acetyltransferase [Acidobacteriota bacterium]|nr:N-acetyltransferase [Acidobacteriota bacterium]